MINRKVKEENGFAASDGLIAVLIIALFTGLITTIIYNIYLSNESIKRMGTATAYITNIFEYVDKSYYDNITVDGLKTYINNKSEIFDTERNIINISSNDANQTSKNIGATENPRYTINMDIEYYNKTEGNEDKLDLVKQLTVKASYKLGNKNQEIQMTRVKSRENLITPNSPDTSLLKITEGQKIYPIKKINDKWKVCDERDSTWYSYESGYWATVVISSNELKLDDEININDYATAGNLYVWIPRFAYNSTDNLLLFLYSNTNKYVNTTNEYNSLSEIDNNTFKVSTEFKIDNEKSTGIWVNTTSEEAYTILNSIYQRQV